MPTNTNNYKFVKQDELEMYDVKVVNANLDAIDSKIKEVDNKVDNIDFTPIQTQISGKADKVHTHAISDITNLQNSLNSKANTSHTHTVAEVTGLETALANKSDTTHTHSWTSITSKPTTFAPSAHTHAISQISNLQTTLDSKASSETVNAHLGEIEKQLGEEALTTSSQTLKGAINEVKSYASDIKSKWASVIGSPLLSTDTQAQLESKTQTIKNTLSANINANGGSTSGNNTLTQLVNAVSTVGVRIKSMQRGSATLTNNGIRQLDIPINSIDMSKSIILISYRSAYASFSNNFFDLYDVAAQITSNTNIQLSRGRANYEQVHVVWTVVEFSNIKGVQRGSHATTYSSEGATIPINPVDLNKSLLFFTAEQNTGQQYISNNLILGELNSSNIVFTNGQVAKTYQWQVLEF